MPRKPMPSLAPDRVRQKALTVLHAHAISGPLTRDQLRLAISSVLSAAQFDQAVDGLVREGLIEVGQERTIYRGIQGDRAVYPVTTYRLTDEGRRVMETPDARRLTTSPGSRPGLGRPLEGGFRDR